MKTIQFIGLIVCAAFFASCETTETAGGGLQESKRLAALREQQREPQPDEAQGNLWNAGQDVQNRDGNPLAGR
jgi:predicted small secreted protein